MLDIIPRDQEEKHKHFVESYENGNTVGIDFSHAEELVGQLLTLVDATYSDLEQRRATKRLVKQTVYDWLHDKYAYQHPDKYDASGNEYLNPLPKSARA